MPHSDPVSAAPDVAAHALREERANAWTHGLGASAALIGGIVLVALTAQNGDAWKLVSATVFALSLTLLYLASTLYHAAANPVAKARLKVLDHCAIYLLIAGTYTPFTLVGLRATWGWGMFIAIWSLAIAGVVFKLFFTGRFKLLSTGIYIAMGWLVLIVIKPLVAALDASTLGWLVAGGVAYTGGTVFYHRPSLRYSHAIWHLFVVTGSTCHYIAVMSQVLPA